MRSVVVLLAIGTTTMLSGAELSGKWVGTVALDSIQAITLILHQKGDRVEGELAVGTEPLMRRLVNGELRLNELTFSSVHGGWPLRCRLRLRGHALDGYIDYGGRAVAVKMQQESTFPVVLQRVRPEYTEEARRVKNEGSVVSLVQVDPTVKANVKAVKRPLGNGLDEEAIKAVQKWRFRPALQHGNPVSMDTTVEVEFRLR